VPGADDNHVIVHGEAAIMARAGRSRKEPVTTNR
jgi:hypothetical protein